MNASEAEEMGAGDVQQTLHLAHWGTPGFQGKLLQPAHTSYSSLLLLKQFIETGPDLHFLEITLDSDGSDSWR